MRLSDQYSSALRTRQFRGFRSWHVRALADLLCPDLIITADALAARSRERLHTVIQITDTGITPGSALSHTNEEISRRTMPCPVLSIGIPTVISTAALTGEDETEPMFVTRADSDRITDRCASVLAGAVNAAVFGK